jgi:hypothetical protein
VVDLLLLLRTREFSPDASDGGILNPGSRAGDGREFFFAELIAEYAAEGF